MVSKVSGSAVFNVSVIMLFLVLVGCGNSNPANSDEVNGRVIGSIHGVVSDANTNARIEGITITTLADGKIKSVTSDALGYYLIKNLPSGSYELSFSGDSSYAVSRTTVHIPVLQEIIGTSTWPESDFQENFLHSENADMTLNGLNSNLTGRVYTVEDDEHTSLASGVTLVADFSSFDISPDKYFALSNSEGVFQFSDLPATPSVLLRSMPFYVDDLTFSVQTVTASLLPNASTESANLFLEIAPDEPFLVQNNFENDDFGLTDEISVTFSKVMQANSFEISLTGSLGEVGFETTWSNDVTLTIDPYVNALQANQSYSLSLNGYSQDNNVFSETFSFMTQAGIQYLQTNLENVDGMFEQFSVIASIEIEFSMAIDLDNYNGYVNLTDASGAAVAVLESLTSGSRILVVDPLYNLEPDQLYSLGYKVYSIIEGDYETGNFSFRTANTVTPPAAVTNFVTNMGTNWLANWNTTSIAFSWDPVPNATAYRIYANDNHANSDFIRVGAFTTQDYVTNQSGTVSLSSFPQFDFYNSDASQTPFCGGTQLTFKIVASNATGEGAFSSALVIGDEIGPTGTLSQTGSANNISSSDPRTISVHLSTNEYLSPDFLTYGISEGGGNAAYVLPHSSITFEWDLDMKGATFTIIVPAATNGAGDLFYTYGFKDNSGNTVASNVTRTLN